MICLIPLILLGYSHSIQTSWHHNTAIGGGYTEVQTCVEGFGARIALSDQWVQLGPQYGHSIMIGQFRITGQVHGGLGYSNEIYRHVRQISYFNVGLGVVATYNNFVIKGGFEHMSNGQIGNFHSNRGQDMVLLGGGYEF